MSLKKKEQAIYYTNYNAIMDIKTEKENLEHQLTAMVKNNTQLRLKTSDMEKEVLILLISKTNLENERKVTQLRLKKLKEDSELYKNSEKEYYDCTTQLEGIKREYLIVQKDICDFKANASDQIVNYVGKPCSDEDIHLGYDSLQSQCKSLYDKLQLKVENVQNALKYLTGMEIDFYLRKQDYFTALVPQVKAYRSAYVTDNIKKATLAELFMLNDKNDLLQKEILILQTTLKDTKNNHLYKYKSSHSIYTTYTPNSSTMTLQKSFSTCLNKTKPQHGLQAIVM